MEGVGGALLELGDEVPVEATGIVRLGVDQKRPAADLTGEREQPPEHILEEAGAKSRPLMTDVDAEAGEESDGLRIAPASFAQPRRSVGGVKLRHAPAVVRHHRNRMAFGHDKDAGRADRGGLPGVAAEPQCLLGRPALEPPDVVIVPQGLGTGIYPEVTQRRARAGT